jgi:acyl-CoA synthetase (AMP-forming)/AMP-acid ligase II
VLLHELIENGARRAGAGLALATDDGREWTFTELDARVGEVAAAFRLLAAPGTRVAILSENTGEYVECYYAVPRAEMILVVLNYRLHPQEWARIMTDAGAEVLVGERALLDRLGLDRPGCVRHVVCTDDPVAGEIPFGDLTGEAPPPFTGSDGDVAWLIYTSGTTGRPKGVMLTHRSIVAAATATSLMRPVQPDDVYLFPFPLCHVAGYNVVLFHLHGRPVVLMRRFDPAAALREIEARRITSVSLAPTMVDMLCDHPDLRTRDRSSLRVIGYGASSMPPKVLRRAVDTLRCDLSQGYGMTELSGNAVFLDADAHRAAAAGDERLLRAAGWPHPLCSVRIVDDAGADVPEGGVGEIVVRGDQVAAGYWNDPEGTVAAFGDGWLRTGDLGRIDPRDGLVTVVDRKKDVIVTGGENVASREVEDVLAEHPLVKEVAVVGAPDDRWGQVVCAVVVTTPGASVGGEDLEAHVRAHLAGYKTPRRWVFVDELPKTASGKVGKADVRAALTEGRS